MQKVKVEKWGGIEVSRLGYGCMRLPMVDGEIDKELSEKMIDTAYLNGVNYFDTAYVYLNGKSEIFVGQALKKYPRDSYYIATKLPTWMVSEEKDVHHILEEQLNKLDMDYVDFYLIHGVTATRLEMMRKYDIYEKCLELKKSGKIKFLGFSFHGSLDTLQTVLDEYDWDFVLVQINYTDWDMIGAKNFYHLLEEKGVPSIIMEPVRGGFLANPPDEVKDLMAAEDPSVSPAGWALRWCMDLDNAPVILSGMSEQGQVDENLKIFEKERKLSDSEKAMFEKAVNCFKKVNAVGCTYCGYCMDCPHGVDIPGIFRIYNIHQIFKNNFRASSDYNDFMVRGRGFDKCTKCDVCAKQCPQNIAISEKLEELHEFLLKVND